MISTNYIRMTIDIIRVQLILLDPELFIQKLIQANNKEQSHTHTQNCITGPL